MDASPTKKMVFVVDDERALRELYSILAEDAGCDVMTFASAEDGLARIPLLPCPDILLVDYTLPKKTGTEFVRELIERKPEIRETSSVVGLSSHSPKMPDIVGFREVIDQYFEKPNDVDEFVAMLRGLLDR